MLSPKKVIKSMSLGCVLVGMLFRSFGVGGGGMKIKKAPVGLKRNFFHLRFHFVIACILNVQNFLFVTGGWRWKHLWTGANGLKKKKLFQHQTLRIKKPELDLMLLVA